MKKIKLSLIFIVVVSFFALAQKPQPKSWTINNLKNIEPIVLVKPDLTKLRTEDKINDLDKSIPWRFGYDHFVDYGLKNAGDWDTLSNGDRIWRVNIISPGALTMNLIFDSYNIPVGGKVYVYNNDRSQILNTFTNLHNSAEEILGTWLVSGESIWVEYFEPSKVKGLGRLNIGNVIHGYRTTAMYSENNARALNDSGPCNFDVNCDISNTSVLANDIKNDVKKSVGMLVSGGNGFCTGALVNNTNNDQAPYFLTANHCLGGSVAGWAFRFNWASDESVADCATNAPSVNNTFLQTASGAILRASNSESDMALVEITDTAFFNTNPDVVWAGWNRSTTAVPSLNVGVHHPRGDIQKVCVDFEGATRTVTSFNGNPTTEMWRIADWDIGVTEPGSSGSPLFDQDGLIIGKLSGGSAACAGTNDNGGFDVYGRFGVSWDFGSTNATQLRFWLDPAGTNPTTMGQFPPLQVFDNDASISILNIPADLCDDAITPTLRITNSGNLQLTTATIVTQLDSDNPETITWTGNLATDEFDDISLSSISVTGEGAHTFSATLSNPNGTIDESLNDNDSEITFNIPENFSTNTVRVVITPDRFGAETTWQLLDSGGTIVESGGPYVTIGTNGIQADEVEDVTISVFDCYTFTINDSFGDGICCAFGAGTYRIEDGDSNIIVNGNGDFGSSASNIFEISDPTLSTTDITFANSLKIYPNPTQNNLTVSLIGSSNVSYNIVNLLGQNIKRGVFNNGTNTLNMANEASGVYFITLTDNVTNRSIVRKIIKQ